MTQQIINTGSALNDGTGESVRSAFTKTNANFTDVYDQIATIVTGSGEAAVLIEQIKLGTSPVVSPLTGAEIVPVSSSSLLKQTTINAMSTFALTPFSTASATSAGTINGSENIFASRGSGLLQTNPSSLSQYTVNAFQGFANPNAGAVNRTVAAKLQEVVSVKDFGAKGDGSTDDTVAIQLAFTLLGNGAIKSLMFPDGNYIISSSLVIGVTDLNNLVGIHVYGQSRDGTIITQIGTNVPIITIRGQFMHTFNFHTMTLQYSAMQFGNTNASCFFITGNSGGSFYNSNFSDISGNNFYWFMNAPVLAWWGNTYRDMWLGDFAGGVNSIAAGVGEPNCRFDRMYISCQSAVEALFNHNAMSAQYDNIEVNSTDAGAVMLYDVGSGNHIVGHWALEGGTYNSDATLFNVVNGTLSIVQIYTQSLTIGVGATLTCFQCQGDNSFVNIGYHQMTEFTSNLGTWIEFNCAGTLQSHIKYINIPFSTSCWLVDVGGTVSADWVAVDQWNDISSIQMNPDADLVLSFDSPMTQIFDIPLTATRNVTLPLEGPNPGNQLFSGRRFRFVKTNTSAHPININLFGGGTLVTMASGQKTNLEIVWNRDGGANGWSWIVIQNNTIT